MYTLITKKTYSGPFFFQPTPFEFFSVQSSFSDILRMNSKHDKNEGTCTPGGGRGKRLPPVVNPASPEGREG